MALGDIVQPFLWGGSGKRMTPEEIARQREIAQSLLAVDTSPVDHWTQGAARMANALVGRIKDSRAESATAMNAEADKASIASMLAGLGGGAGFPSAVATGSSPTSAMATGTPVVVPSAPEIRQGLISRGLPEHVADAFILNFQDESGLNPGINEKNPIVPGSRGGFGLYQLTGPRRTAYEQFAAQRGIDPSNADAQLDFLMTELQGPEAKAAQSILSAPDTATAAQAIVNDFLRPAAEHRASRAAKYARVAGAPASEGAQVASLDPSIGLPQSGVAQALAATPQPTNAAQAINAIAPQAQQAPAVDPQLLAYNDAALGGVLSPSGGTNVAQALTGYFPEAPSANATPMAQSPAPTASTGGINPAIIEALSSPYASKQVQNIAGLLLNQQFDQQQEGRRAQAARDNWLFQQQYQEQAQARDPMRALQAQKLQAELNQLRTGTPGANSSFGNLDAQARAAGLTPGTPEYQDFMLNGGGAPATFRALDMQAKAAGFQPGTPEYNQFMATRGAGLSAGAAQTAKNEADIATGGAAAGAVDLGKASIKAGTDAWADYGKLQTSVGNINEAIAAIDNGAQSGVIYKMLPNITEASASLQNAMDRMGLDVIGSVTFGALSEEEMRLAMQTAAPRDLSPPELKNWLVRKRDAQIKAGDMLADAAQYLTKPGNTINGWIERNRRAKAEATAPNATETPGGVVDFSDFFKQ